MPLLWGMQPQCEQSDGAASEPRSRLIEPLVAEMSKDEMRATILRQADLIAEQQQEIHQLRETQRKLAFDNHVLATELEQAEQELRKSKRQAAPFGRDDKDKKPKDSHKKPGRKKGHPGSNRPPPETDDAEEVPLDICPDCGADLEGVPKMRRNQVISEIVIQVLHKRITTYVCTCPHCDHDVCSRHPWQTSTATGAAAAQLGPMAQAIAMALNAQYGVTMHKVCDILGGIFDLKLTPGGLSQMLARHADRMRPDYEALIEQLRQASVVHMDETGWYVGERGHYLHVATNPDATVYHIHPTRNGQIVLEVLGDDFAGTLVSDALNIYDNAADKQHKCYAHHLKAISDAIGKHPDGDNEYLRDLQTLLRDGIALKKAAAEITPDEFTAERRTLGTRAKALLANPRGDPLEEKLRKRLAKQQEHLFTFLDNPEVPATNNLAERQLRPAVISRKLSSGNRTENGARTWETTRSIIVTCKQQGESVIDRLLQVVRNFSQN